MSYRHLLPLLVTALVAAPPALAQYKWQDENGRMVYSDKPPPASVAPSAVLRAPARPALAPSAGGSGATANDSPAATATATASASAPAQTTADREMAFRKRKLEQAEADRKAAETEARAARAASACEAARTDVRTIESGMPIAQINARNEREILDETTRAARLDAARRTVRENCTAS